MADLSEYKLTIASNADVTLGNVVTSTVNIGDVTLSKEPDYYHGGANGLSVGRTVTNYLVVSADANIGGEFNFGNGNTIIRGTAAGGDAIITTGNIKLDTGGQLVFSDGSVQTVAYTGGGGGNPFDQDLNTSNDVTFNSVTTSGNVVIGNSGQESHLIIDASNYWTSIQWTNMTSLQDPGATPFECQAQLLRVFRGQGHVNNHEELVAVTAVQPSGTSNNGLMITTSDGKIPDSGANDGVGTQYDWVFGGDGTLTFPNTNITSSQRYGMGNLVAVSDGTWTLGEYNGSSYGQTGITINPGIEGPTGLYLPSQNDASTNPTALYNSSGNVQIQVANGSGYFFEPETLTLPNNVKQTTTNTIQCNINADTVIYTGNNNMHTFKILLKVEGFELDNLTGWETQSCEMMVAKSFRNNNVVGTVYGLVYTSENPLATFNARWNSSTSRVEITCRPTSSTYEVYVRSFVTEITTSD